MDDDKKSDDKPAKVAPPVPSTLRLSYAGPSDELIFETAIFHRGAVVEVPAELYERFRAHALSREGHALNLVVD